MRMPRKAGEVVAGAIVAEVVEQQKRIGLASVAKAEGAAQLDAGALDGGLRLDDAFDGTNGHWGTSRTTRPRRFGTGTGPRKLRTGRYRPSGSCARSRRRRRPGRRSARV